MSLFMFLRNPRDYGSGADDHKLLPVHLTPEHQVSDRSSVTLSADSEMTTSRVDTDFNRDYKLLSGIQSSS